MEKIVRYRKSTDGKHDRLFQQTAHKDWARRLKAWQEDHLLPEPMPTGHIMFLYRNRYRASEVYAQFEPVNFRWLGHKAVPLTY